MAIPPIPPTRPQARPTTRDSRPISARLSQLTPERLSTILQDGERGYTQDFVDLCDRMVQIDATVRASYETRLAAVSGARIVIEPGAPTGDPARDRYAAAAAELVERQYRDLDIASRAHEALDAIGKGFAAHQQHWTWIDGTWVVSQLEWIHQRRFRFGRDWHLLLVDDGESWDVTGVELEPDLWMVHQPKTIAGYPGVTGVLRAVCWPYLFKRWAQQFWIQGAESFAWPFLFAKVPRNAPAEVRQRALEGLEQLSADHRAVIEDPAAFELLETTVKDGGTWRDAHNAFNAEITKAILGMTDATEATRIGAYAAVETRAGMTVDARIAMDERALAETFRAQLNERIVRLNKHRFGGMIPPIPTTRWVIQSKRREIPAHLMSVATADELRASLDLAPLPDERGKRLFGDDGVQAISPEGDGALAATGAPSTDVQALAFNGAQTEALIALIEKVRLGVIPKPSAEIMIPAMFPTISRDVAAAMLAPVVVDAQAAPESAPAQMR